MNVGVVGIGYWGEKVVEEYASLRNTGDIEKVYAIDEDPAKLSQLSSVDETFRTLSEALPEADAFHVCTPNTSHFQIAKKILDQRKHALIEKPLTPQSKTSFDLVELASEQGCILQTGHIFRFANVIRKSKELYQDDELGQIHHLTLRWTHQITPVPGTSVLWDLLPHPIDILNFVTGEWPTVVSCEAVTNSAGQDIAAVVQLKIDDIVVDIQVSWVDPIRRRDLEIAGSEKGCRIECVDQTIQIHGDNTDEPIQVEHNNTIQAEAENFIGSIQTNENTYNSAIVGARTVDTIEEIETSAHE